MKIRLKDFTASPGPHLRLEGNFSGQQWREDYLQPALNQAILENKTLIVDLDGVDGFASSFLKGAFDTLVLDGAKLDIRCTDEPGIIQYITSRYFE